MPIWTLQDQMIPIIVPSQVTFYSGRYIGLVIASLSLRPGLQRMQLQPQRWCVLSFRTDFPTGLALSGCLLISNYSSCLKWRDESQKLNCINKQTIKRPEREREDADGWKFLLKQIIDALRVEGENSGSSWWCPLRKMSSVQSGSRPSGWHRRMPVCSQYPTLITF